MSFFPSSRFPPNRRIGTSRAFNPNTVAEEPSEFATFQSTYKNIDLTPVLPGGVITDGSVITWSSAASKFIVGAGSGPPPLPPPPAGYRTLTNVYALFNMFPSPGTWSGDVNVTPPDVNITIAPTIETTLSIIGAIASSGTTADSALGIPANSFQMGGTQMTVYEPGQYEITWSVGIFPLYNGLQPFQALIYAQ